MRILVWAPDEYSMWNVHVVAASAVCTCLCVFTVQWNAPKMNKWTENDIEIQVQKLVDGLCRKPALPVDVCVCVWGCVLCAFYVFQFILQRWLYTVTHINGPKYHSKIIIKNMHGEHIHGTMCIILHRDESGMRNRELTHTHTHTGGIHKINSASEWDEERKRVCERRRYRINQVSMSLSLSRYLCVRARRLPAAVVVVAGLG